MPTYSDAICQGCPYHPAEALALAPTGSRAHAPLDAERNGSRTLLVARAPGIDEWEDGRPLISPNYRSAAHRVRKSHGRLGRDRRDYDFTNTVQCYPGKQPSRNGKPPRDNAPAPAAIAHCRQWLQRTITAGRYTKIVAIGKEAVEAVASCKRPPGVVIRKIPHPSSGRLTNKALDAALT